MASRNAWPFFLFQLNWPEVGSEPEPEKPYGSSRATGVLLSCICRTVSSCCSSASLASSSMIFELAWANFLSAFRQLFSTILTLSVRLSWWSLYHSTFLSNSEDASSSIRQMMFSYVIQKAFSTSLDGISTVNAFEASTTCKVYTSHISHPSQWVVVMN